MSLLFRSVIKIRMMHFHRLIGCCLTSNSIYFMHIQDRNKINNRSIRRLSKGPVSKGNGKWKNCVLNRGGKFSLVTGRLLTNQNELLQGVFTVLRTWLFLNTGRLLAGEKTERPISIPGRPRVFFKDLSSF